MPLRRTRPVEGSTDGTVDGPPEASETLVVSFDSVVGDGSGVFVRGWAFDTTGPLTEARIGIGGATVAITEWYARPDVAAAFPGIDVPRECGFAAHIPLEATYDITVAGVTPTGAVSTTVRTGDVRAEPEASWTEAFDGFVDWVNETDRRVLEIGSRRVVTEPLRGRFGEGRYVGFDIHPDDNTDVVGDVHRLSEYFEEADFDAVFSIKVLEHLAMPWQAALEVNRILAPGGRTFHATNQTWPLHFWPWDFFRFSSEALKVLFSAPAGYEVLAEGHSDPVEVHVPHDPEHVAIPAEPAYSMSWVLAAKVSEPQPSLRWHSDTADVTGGTSYPVPDDNTCDTTRPP